MRVVLVHVQLAVATGGYHDVARLVGPGVDRIVESRVRVPGGDDAGDLAVS